MENIIPQDIPLKQCLACREWKPATPENFVIARRRADGFCNPCKVCRKAGRKCQPAIIAPPGQKWCAQCERFLPATTEHFAMNKHLKDGWNHKCKECQSANWRTKHPLKREKPPEGCKRCVTCHEIYPATIEYFESSKRKYDKGLRPQCRQCRAKEWKAYNDTHVEYRKQYYQEHKERISKRCKIYYETNREEIRKRERQRYQRYGREFGQRYRRTHAEQYKAYNENRRARKKAVPGIYTPAQIQEQLKRQRYHCYYAACGYAKFKKAKGKYVYHIEHTIPITREGARNDISHIVLACPSCNSKKGSKYPHEWPEGGRLM